MIHPADGRNVIAAWLMATGLAISSGVSTAEAAPALSKKNARALVELEAVGAPAVSVALICAPGKSGVVAEAARGLGGRVRYRHAAVDFLSVTLPTEAVRRFLEQPAIEAAGIDNPDSQYRYRSLLPDEQNGAGSSRTASTGRVEVPLDGTVRPEWPPQPTAYPLDKPYDVLRALDADRFRRDHPTFDGRGVVIAHVEGLADLLVPELQTALDLEGRPVPKVLDVVINPMVKAVLTEEAPRADWQWTRLGPLQRGAAGRISADGKSYVLPAASAEYRLGFIDVPTHLLTPLNLPGRDLGAQDQGDYISKAKESFRGKTARLAVLWSERSKTAWLDINGNDDFSDEAEVGEYRTSQRAGVLGKDDPATPRRESRAYVIVRDGDHLAVGIDGSKHATMVAGAAAGHRGARGRVDGVAPGAQIIEVQPGRSFSSYGWAMIQAFSDPRSDVVLLEGQYPLMDDDHLKDGRSVLGLLTSRLSRRYGKPSFWTANNEPSMSAIMDPCIAPETVCVGAYDAAESTLVHFGMRLPDDESLHSTGSEGPAGVGALKPDLVSPSAMITPRDGYMANDSFNSLPGLYQLPANYMVSGGTSTATPIATGAAALLISAAKQSRLPHDAFSIKRALTGSARYLANAGSYQQGAGVIQVGAAWRQLQSQGRSSAPLSIAVIAPVHTANSHLLPVPHQGVGLFEREGWRAGDKAVRRITLTRRNGPAGDLRLQTRLQGNRGAAFTVAPDVQLPLGKPVTVEIEVAPKEEGVYSATLQLLHPSQSDPAVSVPLTVVVPYELDAVNGYARDLHLDVRRLGRAAFFVRVPPGADVLTIELAYNSKIMGMIHDPTGRQQGSNLRLNTISGNTRETIPMPQPGVWGVFFYDWTGRWAYFKGQEEFSTYQLDGAVPPAAMDVRVSAGAVTIASDAANGRLAAGETAAVTVSNTLAGLEQARLVGKVGAVRTVRGTLKRGEQQTFEMDVRPGTEILAADVRPLGGASLDVDLYLHDCTGEKCSLVRTSRGYAGQERVLVENPAPGRWKVILDASAARAASALFEYRDVQASGGAGVIGILDSPSSRAPGAQWQVRLKPWLAEVEAAGRSPVAVLYVQDANRYTRELGDSLRQIYGCKTFPYCFSERNEVMPLGFTLLPLAGVQTAREW